MNINNEEEIENLVSIFQSAEAILSNFTNLSKKFMETHKRYVEDGVNLEVCEDLMEILHYALELKACCDIKCVIQEQNSNKTKLISKQMLDRTYPINIINEIMDFIKYIKENSENIDDDIFLDLLKDTMTAIAINIDNMRNTMNNINDDYKKSGEQLRKLNIGMAKVKTKVK